MKIAIQVQNEEQWRTVAEYYNRNHNTPTTSCFNPNLPYLSNLSGVWRNVGSDSIIKNLLSLTVIDFETFSFLTGQIAPLPSAIKGILPERKFLYTINKEWVLVGPIGMSHKDFESLALAYGSFK